MPPAIGSTLGYCTNVHAGADFAAIKRNLETYAVPIAERLEGDDPLGVGLWFPAHAAKQVIAAGQAARLRDWMLDRGLTPYTLNGFPQVDFHQPRVKHRVYHPDWRTPQRLEYTRDLIRLLAELLPDGRTEGSISTLPLGWGEDFRGGDIERGAAAMPLMDLVHELARLELDTGKHLHLDLEPEPGCVLSTSADAANFWDRHLLGQGDDPAVLGYLRVCHDVCHAAVMFEPQADVLTRYRSLGIKVGKVQISNAIRARFDEMDAATKADALTQLRGFCEDRYLHQTVVRTDDGQTMFYEDLPDALDTVGDNPAEARGEWRVHFHVPVYLDRVGALETTRDEIEACIAALEPDDEARHLEVETYAWGVLPEPLRRDLVDGIVDELAWVRSRLPS